MTMAGLAFSNLARRAARTLLTVLGIALAVGTAVALLALARGVAESVGRGLDETGAEFVVAPKNVTGVLSSRLPETVGAAIAAMDGVQSVSGELYAITVTPDNDSVLVSAWSRDAAGWRLLVGDALRRTGISGRKSTQPVRREQLDAAEIQCRRLARSLFPGR